VARVVSAIWMVRHPPVAVSGVCYGQLDVATTVDAYEAASLVDREFRQRSSASWDVIWSSPWERAERLARVLASQSGVPMYRDARLAELSFGEWEGKRWSELETTDGARFTSWMRAYDTVAPPGGETADALLARVRSFLLDVEQSAGTVLAVAHAGTIRAARAVRTGARFSEVSHAPVPFLVPERI
jgi:alpha-ribazole phosphatase